MTKTKKTLTVQGEDNAFDVEAKAREEAERIVAWLERRGWDRHWDWHWKPGERSQFKRHVLRRIKRAQGAAIGATVLVGMKNLAKIDDK